MNAGITRDDWAHMINGAAAAIRAEHARLSALDCVAGDGDHGATMLRVVDSLTKTFAPGGPEDLRTCLRDAGWSVLGVDGGASSSLMGTFFGGMADATECEAPLSASQLAAVFEAGLMGVRKQTRAQPGDKTMMDTLVPAIGLRASRMRQSPAEALRDAADAARIGAEATRNFTAKYGRARLQGEKTLGHEDPGAVSVGLMFAGFCSGLGESKGESGNARS
jgi:dihydroxyacetone kinase-like protein